MPIAPVAGTVTCTVNGSVDLLALQERHPQRYPYLLQSTAQGTPQGRYDILFAFPGQALGLGGGGGARGFLDALDEAWRRARPGSVASHPELPFRGGWFLFLDYELAAEIEPVLRLPHQPAWPVAWARRIPAAIICDHAAARTTLLAEAGEAQRLEQLRADLQAIAVAAGEAHGDEPLAGALLEEEPVRYLEAVARARRYIHDGDVFQVNLSRRWQAALRPQATAVAIFRRLRRANPAPFAALVLEREFAVISSSPERLVRVRAGRIETRPIAGTRPRGADPATDGALLRELLAHPKERAEHVMLLDLERNDLGRICRTGSVRVDECMVVESYAHVHHIVSNVSGTLRADVTPGGVIRALFPGGTITGCPKVRCMQIIAELEAAPRGAYTGAVGYLNHDGDMDLNILIRTLVQRAEWIEFRAGAGIVADSVPERELEETRAKARGLARALGADA